MNEWRFNVFGTLVAVTGEPGAWRAFYLGVEGKRRPADFIIPDDVSGAELREYLADLFHENATPRNNDVRVLPSQLLFLPGALGRTALWEPVAGLLTHGAAKVHVGWPGFGATTADPSIRGIDDLVAKVVARIAQPSALIAQSMGGVIAMRVALARPDLVTHLVLAVTSGGIDVAGFGGQDWRPAFHDANPTLPRWFSTYQEDLSAQLSSVQIPALLIWGDADPISPVGVGERLASLLPCAQLQVVAGGDHNLAETHAPLLAPLIDAHLLRGRT
jgi:pimeloyl-ACP methyl ester carboxylesterase